ncbi:MAG TPA: heparinase II/III family protein [Candidatus Acidoferrales bacterium]|nr:heparinase II/III family protein [Candidatus Acidoferrales bacterium]
MISVPSRPTRWLLLLAALTVSAAALGAEPTVPPARIREIAAWLPTQPAGFAWPITNRPAWQMLAADPAFAKVVATANKLLAKPLAEVPDSLYLEFSQNGNRTHWENAEFQRRGRIARFTLAEALEHQGRFLPAIEQTVASLCAEKTWVYPAHDGNLANFQGREVTPELGATGLAAELAEAEFVLGDELTSATRELIRDNVRRRVLAPFRDSIEGRRKELHWLRLQMNWNAVCVGNTVFAALALEPSRDDRAFFAAAGEHYIRYYLDGFTPDGYCAEGVGYWNYGFGHFILLTETLRQATGGKIDLLNGDKAVAAALFCRRSEILPGVFPSISDCTPGTKPDAPFVAYVCRRLGLPANGAKLSGVGPGLALGLMLSSLPDHVPLARKPEQDKVSPLRSFFPGGGVLIARNPGPIAFAAALKGGNNDEPHNHNDVGSFSVVLGREMVICDPGGEVYTRRTFGPHRYDSNVLNSYGHAVPIIAGQLQRTGAAAHGEILETNFTAARDVFKLDIRSAYAVPALEKLERTFAFERGDKPSLTVSDAVKFSEPQAFQTALITWGQARSIDANTLEISDRGSSVRVSIDTQGHPFKWSQDLIDEDVESKRKPFHLGITLDDKVTEAVVTLRVEPRAD